MKAKLILLLIAFSVSNIFAQTDSLSFQKEINELSDKVNLLEEGIEQIKTENKAFAKESQSLINTQNVLRRENQQLIKDFDAYKQSAERKIDSLQQIIWSNSANIKTTADELGVKIDETHKATNQNIKELNETISQNTLYWIIAILIVAIFVLLVFILLKKQIFKQKTDLDSNLQNTRKALEEEGVKLDNKLIEVLETQLKIINNSNSVSGKEGDHTLALKVADEIVRIEKNISKMDTDTKGIKPLVKGIERIKDNFKANGYDMVQLLDKEYDDRMNIDVINFIDDDSIPSGKKIITRIIKPQVNYNDVLIQRAQVDVSQN
jgi:FtsZ-binding cell division protein ZapB